MEKNQAKVSFPSAVPGKVTGKWHPGKECKIPAKQSSVFLAVFFVHFEEFSANDLCVTQWSGFTVAEFQRFLLFRLQALIFGSRKQFLKASFKK